MNVLQKARDALNLIKQGREALAKVADSVADGTAALAAGDQAELDRMLEEELAETRAAHASLAQAIAAARG